MAAVKFLTSLVLASFVMTSLVKSACIHQKLSVDPATMSIFCAHGEERKPLGEAWVSMATCEVCTCTPKGMECCSVHDPSFTRHCGPTNAIGRI